MKIAITTVQMPFIDGGAEFLARNLKTELIRRGHEAEIVAIPFIDNPLQKIEDHIIASRLFDIEYSWAGKIDLCIGLKFPAYFIPHPNKVIWMLHQHRGAYDLFNTEYTNLKRDDSGLHTQQIIHDADCRYLREAREIYTISQTVSERLLRYNKIPSRPLYHPCPDMDKFYCGNDENYILMPSRVSRTKRQILALEAMCLTKTNIKLSLVGRADNDSEKQQLLAFINEHNLQDRVKYFDYVTQEEKFNLYANAKAVLFIPKDEDYGYITLEAMAASKAVITAMDSGGPLSFVQDEKTGEVVEPSPEEIAHAIDYLALSTHAAADMGRNAKKHLNELGITWDNVIKELIKI